MVCRRLVWLAVFCLAVLAPARASAQARDAFVQALVDLAETADGRRGSDGSRLPEIVEQLAVALQAWDARVRGVEAGLQSEIAAAPQKAAARMRATLGLAYLERGRAADALGQFDLAQALDATFVEARLLRADALATLARTADAAGAARAAWELSPGNVTNAYLLLRRLGPQAQGDAVAAPLRTLASGLGASPAPVAVSWLAGAARLLDDAASTGPVFALAAYGPVFEAVRQARYADAVTRARLAVGTDPLATDSALRRPGVQDAARAMGEGRHAEAAGRFEALDPARGSAQLQRLAGLAHLAAGDHARSLVALRAALRLAPLDERAHLALADALVASGDADAAMASLRRTVQAIPRSGQAYWALGRLLQAGGQEAEALAAFERAARIGPFVGASHVLAAIGRLRHNQLALDGAAEAYAARVDLAPADPAAHLALADVWRAQDRRDAALAEYLIAAHLEPGNARTLATIGQLHAAAGRDEEAVAVWRLALAADAGHLEARYALSRALLRLGRTAEAAEELQRFQDVQARALADERRKFLDNARRLQDAVDGASIPGGSAAGAGGPGGPR